MHSCLVQSYWYADFPMCIQVLGPEKLFFFVKLTSNYIQLACHNRQKAYRQNVETVSFGKKSLLFLLLTNVCIYTILSCKSRKKSSLHCFSALFFSMHPLTLGNLSHSCCYNDVVFVYIVYTLFFQSVAVFIFHEILHCIQWSMMHFVSKKSRLLVTQSEIIMRISIDPKNCEII